MASVKIMDQEAIRRAVLRMAHEMLEGSRPHPRGKIVLRISV